MPTVKTGTVQRTRVITINRPQRRNSVDGPTAQLLTEAFLAFDADDDVDVAVLTGADGNFCAGADLKAIAEGNGNRVAETGDGPMGPTRLRLTKPVIAAIEGYAVAGGLELAAWCDLRVASEHAVLGVFCRRFGVPLVDLGTVRLPRLIGQSRAMDLILTGRGVEGAEALSMGLVNRARRNGPQRRPRSRGVAQRPAAALPTPRPHLGDRAMGHARGRGAGERGPPRPGDHQVRRDRSGCRTILVGCRPPRRRGRIAANERPAVRHGARRVHTTLTPDRPCAVGAAES